MRAGVMIVVLALVALLGVDIARAEITIESARYAAGILVVRGKTAEPQQLVTLNRRYHKKSFHNGVFLFRLQYLPRDCMVHVTAGSDEARAPVDNCK